MWDVVVLTKNIQKNTKNNRINEMNLSEGYTWEGITVQEFRKQIE